MQKGMIPFKAEVRLFYLCMQIDSKLDDTAAVPDSNVVQAESTDEQTDFKVLWPHLRDNLKTMGRIKPAEVPLNLKELW